jgi:predicted TIM-barrel fold metal-dependent hydrolase
MIDAHIHAVKPRLAGVKSLPPILDAPSDQLAASLRQQMQDSGTTVALAMGHMSGADDDPLGIASTLRLAQQVPGLYAIGVADPTRTDTDHLQRVERQLQTGTAKALKGYLGYTYFGPESPAYAPYFELAAKYQIPFVFHTGDNPSEVAKVKYAHPLLIDEVAVENRRTKFILAHFGNPWVVDAAEVVRRNENVWADLSGMLNGDTAQFAALSAHGALARTAERIRQSIEYTNRPDKFLYGSDWPLAPMPAYADFVRQMVPAEAYQAVFEENARVLFRV